MITCSRWVPRGAAKEVPDKYEVTEEDVQQWVEKLEAEEAAEGGASSGDEAMGNASSSSQRTVAKKQGTKQKRGGKGSRRTQEEVEEENQEEQEIIRRFNMDTYDEDSDEEDMLGVLGGVEAMNLYQEEDEYLQNQSDTDTEEIEDYTIRPDDLLVLATKCDEESMSSLQLYVFEEENQNIFVHHDILLAGTPLCLEWLSHDVQKTGFSGNFAAVGTFSPTIEIWDLDTLEAPEPAAVLGGELSMEEVVAQTRGKKTTSKRRKKALYKELAARGPVTKRGSHTDAVLSLSWNQHFRHLLASGSADGTVKVWDLDQLACGETLRHHTDKVQCVKWSIFDPMILLTGGYDRQVCAVDFANVKSPSGIRRWTISSDVEDMQWCPHNKERFMVSTEDGFVHVFSTEEENCLYSIEAHAEACSAVAMNPSIPDFMATISNDQHVKLWSLSGDKPSCMYSRKLDMGPLFTASFCPDSPFTLVIGGAKGTLLLWNTLELNIVKQSCSAFTTPELLALVGQGKNAMVQMNTGDVEEGDGYSSEEEDMSDEE